MLPEQIPGEKSIKTQFFLFTYHYYTTIINHNNITSFGKSFRIFPTEDQILFFHSQLHASTTLKKKKKKKSKMTQPNNSLINTHGSQRVNKINN